MKVLLIIVGLILLITLGIGGYFFITTGGSKKLFITKSESKQENLQIKNTNTQSTIQTKEEAPKKQNFPKGVVVDFTLPKYDETGNVTLSQLYNDRPTVIQFWATWCEICRAEFPENNRIAQKYKGKINYIAVDWAQSDRTAVVDYIDELKLDPTAITFVMDGDGKVGASYGLRGTPMHVFIKKGGNNLATIIGKLSPQGFEFLVKELIKE